MKREEVVHGFKVFNTDWTCSPDGNTKQYTCPGKFEEGVIPNICDQGMHFCENAADCFKYYRFDRNNKVAEVIAYGQVVREGDKSCTDKLEIIREIPWDEVLRIVNAGKDCTGIHNTGDCNTGDCNKSSFNNGCFMTEEPTIMMFNKPTDWTYREWSASDASRLLNQISKNVVEWVCELDMSNEEKAKHPAYKATGGYLKVPDESNWGQLWWDRLSEPDRNIIRSIPNFDAAIFVEITGIKVNQ